MSDPVVEAITIAKLDLIMHQATAFYGSLSTYLEPKEADDWCKSISTDGRHLFYNREYIKSLTKPELIWSISHLVLHCVYDHLGRCEGREKEVWDMACDYRINYDLENSGQPIGKRPEGALYEKKFNEDMTTEEIYNLLLKNSVKIKMPLDQHLDTSSGNEDGEGSGEGSVRVMGEGDGPPNLSKEDIDKISNTFKSAVLSAAAAFGAGNCPLGIRRMVESLTNPKMSWKELLDTHIRSAMKDDYTFQRPSRRGHNGFIFPGQNFKTTIDVVCAIDCSGSMTDEMLRDFLSEIKGIMETFGDYRLALYVFDTSVYNYTLFTPENGEDIERYPMAGGGGTSFECCFDYMKENDIEPERFIMFTDGYPNASWGDPNFCDTLFVIYGNAQRNIVAPFGQTAYYE